MYDYIVVGGGSAGCVMAARLSENRDTRVLLVEHGHYTASYGSHILSEIAQAAPGVKMKKIAFPDVPGPGSAEMMTWLRPDAPKILDASIQMMKA